MATGHAPAETSAFRVEGDGAVEGDGEGMSRRCRCEKQETREGASRGRGAAGGGGGASGDTRTRTSWLAGRVAVDEEEPVAGPEVAPAG